MKQKLMRAHVWLLAGLTPLLVKVMPLKWLLGLLTPPGRFRPYRGLGADQIVEAVRRRLAAPKNMRRRACLREALMLFHFLRLAGEPAVMHFSVYAPGDDSRMHAHCWVTVGDRAVSSPPGDPHATMLTRGEGLGSPRRRQEGATGRPCQ